MNKNVQSINLSGKHIPLPYLLLDKNSKIIEVNQLFIKLTGYSQDDVIDTGFDSFLTDESKKNFRTSFSCVQSEGRLLNNEFEIVHKAGLKLSVLLNSSAENTKQGKFYQLHCMITDVSGYKNSESKTHQSEQLFRALVENSPDFIARYDSEYRRIYVNLAIQKLFKNKKEDILGKTPEKYSPVYAPQVYIEHLKKVFEMSKETTVEMPFRTANGEMHWGHMRFVPEFGTDGRVETVLAIGRDIHEVKEREQRFRMLAENFPDFVLHFDRNYMITYANPVMEKALGFSVQKLVGKTLSKLPGNENKEQSAALEKLVHHVFNKGVSDTSEATLQTIAGDRIFEVRFAPEKDATGNVVSVLGIMRDITELKHNYEINAARLHLLQFAETHSLDDLLEETLNEAEKLSGSLIGFYHFVEDDQKSLTLQSWSARTKAEFCQAEGRGKHDLIDEAGVWADCVREQKAIIHNDYKSLPHRKELPEGHAKIIRELVVPVMRGENVKAILGVGNKSSDYNSRDLAVVKLLADLAWEIAERKRTEQALLESEKRYRIIADNTYDWEFWINPEGQFLYNSPSCQRITGYQADEFVKDPDLLDRIIHPDDRKYFKQHRKQVNSKKIPGEIEFRVIQPDGSIRFIGHICQPVYDEQGKYLGKRGSNRDITDRKKTETILKESEEFLSSIVENIPDMIFIKDAKDLKFVRLNKASENLLGFDRNELMGKTDFDFFTKEQAQFFKENDLKVLNSGNKLEISEEPINTKHGERILHTKKIPIYNKDGNPAHILGISEDITDRKKMEETLRSNEQRLQLAAEASQMGLWDWNIVTGDVIWSDQCKAHYGFSPETSMSYELFLQAIHPDDRERVNAALNRAVEERSNYNETKRTVWPDGSLHWTNSRAKVYCDNNGKPVRMVGVTFDITNQKQVEEAALRREREYRSLAENTPDNIVRYNRECRAIYINPAMSRTISMNPEMVLGKTPVELRAGTPEVDVEYEGCIRHVLETGEPTNLEITMPNYGGKFRSHSIRFVAERDTDRKIIGVLAIGHDITDLKKAEQEHQAHLNFFESMDKINRAIQGTNDVEQMMGDVLDVVQDIFDSDRAFLLYPCDPDSPTWTIPMERTKSEYPGVYADNITMDTDEDVASTFRLLLESEVPVKFAPDTNQVVPENVATRFNVKSFIGMALHPKTGKPWEFGLHQCSDSRIWTNEETRLFQEIGRRIGDALSSFLYYRNLSKSEERYRLIAENTADVINVFDLNLRPTFVSPSVKKLRGYTIQEAMNQDLGEVLTPQSLKKVEDVLSYELELEQGKNVDPDRSVILELEEYHKDGHTIWVELAASFLRGKDMKVTGILTITRNITQRKQAELELIESEQKFRSLAESIPDNIIRYDTDMRIVYINHNMEKAVDVNLKPYIGRDPDEKLLKKSSPGYLEKLRKVMRTGQEDEFEIDIKNPAGELRTHNIRLICERNNEGNIIGALAVGRDITERKRAQDLLRKLSHAVEQSPVSIIITDTESNIEYVNPKFTKITGFSSAEVLGKKPNVLKSGEHDSKYYKELWDSLKSGKEWHGEFHNRKKNGELFWEYASISPVLDSNGTITHFMAVKEDITERKNLEDQLQQIQKLDAIGQLAGGVAHDFNNMLSVILGYSEMALIKTNPAQQLHKDLQEIKNAAVRSADMTKQLLTFARKQSVTPVELNLNKTVEGMLKILRRLIGEEIMLNWNPENNLWKIKIDPSQVDQILANLCVNARDAIGGIGDITIETNNITLDKHYNDIHPDAVRGDYIQLVVSDNGCGMHQDTIAKIFDPFFTTKEVGKGTGLGLATIYGIVKQNNGFITVQSEPGHGTTFKIFLPRYRVEKKNIESEEKQQLLSGGFETILLVEDEKPILEMTKQMLIELGYNVMTASTPGAALQIAKNYKDEIDILITDVIMPEMNGRTLADKMTELYPNIRRLFMSGYIDNIIAHQTRSEEGSHFIQKPFSLPVLAGKVYEALNTK